jgi:hypothetical protein
MKRFVASFVCLVACASMAMAQDQVMFNYQGRVRVQGQPFNGTGQFKFAIMNTSATATLWTNDGSALGGGQPVGSLNLVVNDGVFNVMVGDPGLGMQPINNTIFSSRTPLKLRTWFNDGTHGFEQLQPDQNLVNVTLVTLTSGDQDFTIYVNCGSGDDANNGLSPATAKRTIQGAVNLVPSTVRCNITIDIANCVYREQVSLTGIMCVNGKKLTLLGDETWVPSLGTAPAVRITGTNSDSTPVKVRGYGLSCDKCTGIVIKGILVDKTSEFGFVFNGTDADVEKCKAVDANSGFVIRHASAINARGCVATQNGVHGFNIGGYSWASMDSCNGSSNGDHGLFVCTMSSAALSTGGTFDNNSGAGIDCAAKSYVQFWSPFTGTMRNNSIGLYVQMDSHSENASAAGVSLTVTGNTAYNYYYTTGGVAY